MKEIYEVLKKSKAYRHALHLISWDMETEIPIQAIENATETIGILSEEEYKIITNSDFVRKVKSIDVEQLNEIDKRVIELIKKYQLEILKIPMNLYTEYERYKRVASASWQKGKQENEYSDYKDKLVHLIELQKDVIKSLGHSENMYDKLLDDYEEGLNQKVADNFFIKIKNELIPFIKQILNSDKTKLENAKRKFFARKYDIEKQKQLSKRISKDLGFDFSKGVIKESEHPFTNSMLSNKDVRFTTHYYENNPISALFSTIHETGHGLYEQNISDELEKTYSLNTGASTAIHEGMSRLYENMIGKNSEFIKYLYSLFIEYFEIDKDGISEEEFNSIINEVNNTLIRTDADELTYPLHILIRYELEKEIYNTNNKIDGDLILKEWNDKYEKYLNISSKNVSESLMQDIHWADGLFGYFPSYAIGSAYAAQIYSKMDERIDVNNCIKNREFIKIRDYLTEYIFKYGASKTPMELLKISSDETFNPNYYIEYLINKFSKIYK